jgi:hypothetical protein
VPASASKTYAPDGTSPLSRRGHWSGLADTAQEQFMLDVFMLALGLGFFVAAVGYTYACERL